MNIDKDVNLNKRVLMDVQGYKILFIFLNIDSTLAPIYLL